jgi:hypothetical protein
LKGVFMIKNTICSVAMAVLGLTSLGSADSNSSNDSFNTFSLGPAYLSGVDSEDMAYLVSLGKYFRAVDYAGIRLNGNAAADFEGFNYYSSVLLGIQAYLNEGVISSYGYVDFGFAYEYSRYYSNQYGFSMAIGPGLIFFKETSAQIFIEPSYQIIFDDDLRQMFGLKIGVNY